MAILDQKLGRAAAAALLCAAMAACGGGSDSAAVPAPVAEAPPEVVSGVALPSSVAVVTATNAT